MKLPPGASEQVFKMVLSSLPYAMPFTPKTDVTKAIIGLVSTLEPYIPEFAEIDGLMWYICEMIENDEVKREKVRSFLHNMCDAIEEQLDNEE